VGPAGDGRYLFSPLGRNTPLVRRPRLQEGIIGRSGPLDVPEPLRRSALKRRPDHDPLNEAYGERKSFYLHGVNSTSQLIICDLKDQPQPNGSILWARPPTGSGLVAVDPERGRIAYPTGEDPGGVRVSFHYAFCAAMGGGQYDRASTFTDPEN
jgi:hypothetical protein